MRYLETFLITTGVFAAGVVIIALIGKFIGAW